MKPVAFGCFSGYTIFEKKKWSVSSFNKQSFYPLIVVIKRKSQAQLSNLRDQTCVLKAAHFF